MDTENVRRTLGTNGFAKTVYGSLLKSLETETEKLILIRTTDSLLENMVVYLYWSRKYRKNSNSSSFDDCT